MDVKITYSLKQEEETVKSLLGKSDFFQKNKYTLRLPDGFKMGMPLSDSVRDTIKKEYLMKEPRYKEVEAEIKKEWKKFGKEINSFLELFDYPVPREVDVELISYGPGGGYTLPNKVGVMVEKQSLNTYLEQVVHEIIHLIFEEPLVKKYKLNQLEKENLVDSMFTHSKLKKLFPSHYYSLNFVMPEKSLLEKIDWR